MAAYQRKNLILGKSLLSKLRIDEFELYYLTIKYQLAVLEDPKRSLRRFIEQEHQTTGYRRVDSEELLGIIQSRPIRLRDLLFLTPELKKLAPPIIKPKDNRPSRRARPRPCVEVKSAEQELGFKRSVSHGNRMYQLPFDYTPLLRETIEDNESDIKNSPNVFYLLGGVWVIKFDKEEVGLYPDKEKYRYIACLLNLSDGKQSTQNSEYSIYNWDLYEKATRRATAKGSQPYSEVMKELNESDLSEKLSVEDIKHFKEVGYDLLEHLGSARQAGNQDQIKKAKDDIDMYCSHLSNEYGIRAVISKDETKITFHQFYRTSNEAEKIRQVVKNQIKNAINDFDRMPIFKSHLRNSIKTKLKKTVYSPEYPIAWTVST